MKLILGLLVLSIQLFAESAEFIPGEFVVTFKKNKNTLLSQKNMLAKSMNSDVDIISPELGVALVRLNSDIDSKTALSSLKDNPNIEIAEPNYTYTANFTLGKEPNDPMTSKLWGMNNVGQPDSNGITGVPGIDINAFMAWKVQTGAKDVIVAVIDTGVDYNNPDLKENMWVNLAENNGKPGVDDDNNGYVDDIHGWNFVEYNGKPLDDNGHGSHCSGTIGAKGNDQKGVVGVTWNTQIMALKFLNAKGQGSLDKALKAIDYAIKNGAKILSNSWSGGNYSENLKMAISRTNDAGAIFVAAAGNNSKNNDKFPAYPASYEVPNVISVAALDNRGKLADFSNYGKEKVDISAPGVNILSTTIKGYESYSGTSMATPHVAGVAALIYSQYPQSTNLEIKNLILKTAKPIKGLKSKIKTGALVDAYAALMQLIPPVNMEDPENWKSLSYQLSSMHPYKAETKETFEISVPEATEISLYFEKFQTEFRYDQLTLLDQKGKIIQTISGVFDGSYSETIPGNYVKLVFQTDKSQEQFGFDISKVSYR